MNIAVIGLGLIGGSMAKSFKARTDHRVFGLDTDSNALFAALAYQAVDERLDENATQEMDCVILCAYPKAMAEFVKGHEFRRGAMVVDCCGVKRDICAELRQTASERGFDFIGGHPMAGKQYAGFKASSAHLFTDASMILTPYDETSIETRARARDLFLKAGFKRVHFTNPEEHDRIIAYTSQLAHIVSNAYAKSPTYHDSRDISAGSFRDLTRVAKLNARMWAELFCENSDNLSFELNFLISRLEEYAAALKSGDRRALEKLLEGEPV